MGSQPILTAGTNYSLTLTSNASVTVPLGGFLGWGFDLNIASSSATGTLYIYTQYSDPATDTNTRAWTLSYPISSGNFGTIGGVSSVTSVAIDSNNVTTKGYVVLKWVGSDASNGTITVVGLENVY